MLFTPAFVKYTTDLIMSKTFLSKPFMKCELTDTKFELNSLFAYFMFSNVDILQIVGKYVYENPILLDLGSAMFSNTITSVEKTRSLGD